MRQPAAAVAAAAAAAGAAAAAAVAAAAAAGQRKKREYQQTFWIGLLQLVYSVSPNHRTSEQKERNQPIPVHVSYQVSACGKESSYSGICDHSHPRTYYYVNTPHGKQIVGQHPTSSFSPALRRHNHTITPNFHVLIFGLFTNCFSRVRRVFQTSRGRVGSGRIGSRGSKVSPGRVGSWPARYTGHVSGQATLTPECFSPDPWVGPVDLTRAGPIHPSRKSYYCSTRVPPWC